MPWVHKQVRLNRMSGQKEPYYSIAWRDTRGKIVCRALKFVSREEANLALAMFRGRMATGLPIDPPSRRRPGSTGSSPGTTLGEYLDLFIERTKKAWAQNTLESKLNSCKALKRLMGHVELRKVDFLVIEKYIETRVAEGRKRGTIDGESILLRGALEHALKAKLITQLPDWPALPRKRRTRSRYLTEEETEVLLEAMRPGYADPLVGHDCQPWVRLAAMFYLNLGMRKNEAFTRKWTDLRWDQGPNGSIFVGEQPEIDYETKTGLERTIPLTPELREELLAAHVHFGKPKDGWIFPAARDPSQHRVNFKYHLDRACDRCGLPRVHTHGLRHSWSTRLAMAGVDRAVLIDVGGWVDGKQLDATYAHASSKHTQEVMAANGVGRRKESVTKGDTVAHDSEGCICIGCTVLSSG